MAGSTSCFNANLQSKLRANLDVSYSFLIGIAKRKPLSPGFRTQGIGGVRRGGIYSPHTIAMYIAPTNNAMATNRINI